MAKEKMQKTMWIVTSIFPFLFMLLIQQTQEVRVMPIMTKILIGLLTIYVVWSAIWGFVFLYSYMEKTKFFGKQESMERWLKTSSPLAVLSIFAIVAFMLFPLFIILGSLYGCLGGGIYQYLKFNRSN